jgi:hypothetical protein
MYPLVYQNLGGVESLWADQTVNTIRAVLADCYSLVPIQCDG